MRSDLQKCLPHMSVFINLEEHNLEKKHANLKLSPAIKLRK